MHNVWMAEPRYTLGLLDKAFLKLCNLSIVVCIGNYDILRSSFTTALLLEVKLLNSHLYFFAKLA